MNGGPNKVQGLKKNREINKRGDVYYAPESKARALTKDKRNLKYSNELTIKKELKEKKRTVRS